MLLYYVPTITSEKNATTSNGRTIPKTSFHVDIFEATKEDGNELIGTASVVLSEIGNSYILDYIRIVSKYESCRNAGTVYHQLTLEEVQTEHDEIVKACKELKEVWG